jgi:8-oxo-dGTP pyrophosphatase MutT (NUDIX family)
VCRLHKNPEKKTEKKKKGDFYFPAGGVKRGEEAELW